MPHPSATSISFTVALTCVAVAMPGCAADPEPDDGDDAAFGSDDGGGEQDASEPPAGEECTFTYENAIYDGGPIDVYLLYLSPASSDELGNDFLGSNILPYGYQVELSEVPAGTYDTMVVDEDGYYYIERVTCDGSDWYWRITTEDVDGMLDV
jgi:hypothetical protein